MPTKRKNDDSKEIVKGKIIYFFGDGIAEGDASPEMIQKLGNKGAQLQEMAKMGLPVPPGFTITTDVCRYYFESGGKLPDNLMDEVKSYMGRIENSVSRKFGDVENDPLLVSARSGAPISMPGMMETILNIGLTDRCLEAYINRHDKDENAARFILDCQRRLYEMFGENVFNIDEGEFRKKIDRMKKKTKIRDEIFFNAGHLEELIKEYRKIYKKSKKEMPQDPYDQLELAIEAVEKSAMGQKAISYRKMEGLPEEVYTGVTIQAMVYGNENLKDCGTGVYFTRDPSTGIKDRDNPFGDFLLGGQGEDVVSGKRNTLPLSYMKEVLPDAYEELMKICDELERKSKRVQDCEFTVWRGKLYILQKRDGKLSGKANIRSSCDMAKEGIITEEEAILRVNPKELEQLLYRMIDYESIKKDGIDLDSILVNPNMGIGASPGGGVGKAVFDVKTAQEYKMRGEPVILFRVETNPNDVPGMMIAEAVATSRGGKASHAAIVSRNKGIPCAVGTGIEIDEENKKITYRNKKGEIVTIREGDVVSVDGNTGKVLHYEAKLTEPDPNDPDLQDFLKLLYPRAKMRVYANANDAEEAKRAKMFGAEGIGLARTEYMFLEDRKEGENRALTIQSWILAEDEKLKNEALRKLEEMQMSDFLEMYEVMEDKPIIIRLLDYPLHELLSDAKDHLEELSNLTGFEKDDLDKRIDSYHEINPMLGHRSVRLGITHPEVYRMQARAILTAAKKFNEKNKEKKVIPHIEIPLVSMPNEVKYIAELIEEEAKKLGFERYNKLSNNENQYRLGIMYEVAGASFNADDLAEITDFGSFGTNDLTQTTLGWSREDGNTTFMPKYLAKGIVEEDPFIRIDKKGSVAKAMLYGVLLARSKKHEYDFGICGEHAADPESIEICYGAGLTNVSPGPNQVPIAWLKSAQLSLTKKYGWMLEDFAKKLYEISEKKLK